MRIVIGLVIAIIVALVAFKLWPTKVDQTSTQVLVEEQQPSIAQAVVDPKIKQPSLPVEEQTDGDGIRRVVIDGSSGFNETMEALGITDLESRFAEWSMSRGYPYSDHTGTYLLEQPYEQYDNETLLAFAENEDMWAQQFLAERLEKTRPAEALDWYRKAAINGSINAMDRITMLYSKLNVARVDDPNYDDTYKEQVYAIRDSPSSADELGFAWSVAAVMAGADPSRNKALSERLGRGFDEDTRDRACGLAGGLYDDLSSARGQRDLGDFERTPPPFMLGSAADIGTTSCEGISASQFLNTSNCEEVKVVTNGIGSSIVVCNNE